MSDPVRQLKTYGRDLAGTHISRLPRNLSRCCFICVNSYRSYRQNIGVTPIQDAVSIAKCLKYFEYEVYFIHNPHCQYFMDYLNYFIAHTGQHLVIYYEGQGTTAEDLDRTIQHAYDDAFTFDDGSVDDEEFIDSLCSLKNPDCKVTLITDTCRANTMWNLTGTELKGRQIPPGVLTMSAVPTESTSKQMMALAQQQGIFTFNMTKELKLNPKITVNQLAAKMAPVMGEFAQEFKVGTSSPELLDEAVIELSDDF